MFFLFFSSLFFLSFFLEPRNSNNNGSFSILHNARERWFFAFADDFTSKIDLKRDFFSKKRESSLFDSFDISLIIFFSFSNISPKIDRNRNFARSFEKYFSKIFWKRRYPRIYIFAQENNKQRNKAHIPGNIGRYIFEKAKEYFVRGKNVENTRVSATIFPPRENRPSTLFTRRTWQRHNCSFSLQPLSFFPPSTLCVKALRQSPVRCTRTGRVRKLGLGRYRSSHQFTTSGQRRN